MFFNYEINLPLNSCDRYRIYDANIAECRQWKYKKNPKYDDLLFEDIRIFCSFQRQASAAAHSALRCMPLFK
jgi:hypothetical protein